MKIEDLINQVIEGGDPTEVMDSVFDKSVDEAKFRGKATSASGNNAILAIAIPTVKTLIDNLSKNPNVGLSTRFGGPDSDEILKDAKVLDGSLKRLKNKLGKFLKKLEASRQ
jgi:hypothetical protein